MAPWQIECCFKTKWFHRKEKNKDGDKNIIYFLWIE